MSSNRLTQTRRFNTPEGWQPGLYFTVVPSFKGVAPMGPVEMQFGLPEWLREQFRQPAMRSRCSSPPVPAYLN